MLLERELCVCPILPRAASTYGRRDLEGKRVEGDLNPSSDTETHRIFYQKFPNIGGVVHTHSRWATLFAQAGRSVRAYVTTHADYYYGEIPCTRDMTEEEIKSAYEYNTGVVAVEHFEKAHLNSDHIPAVLVKNHGPFCWGTDPFNAVYNVVVLEEVAMMAFHTEMLTPGVQAMQKTLLDKYFLRKHGTNAYYGQKKQHTYESSKEQTISALFCIANVFTGG